MPLMGDTRSCLSARDMIRIWSIFLFLDGGIQIASILDKFQAHDDDIVRNDVTIVYASLECVLAVYAFYLAQQRVKNKL